MDIVSSASLTVLSTPATINIKSFFPPDLYLLRHMVLSKAKEKKNNFVIYMLDGCIHMRVNGEKHRNYNPTKVNSDLCCYRSGNFLRKTLCHRRHAIQQPMRLRVSAANPDKRSTAVVSSPSNSSFSSYNTAVTRASFHAIK